MVILGDLLLVCCLYDGIGVVGARVYAGRFTLLKSDCFSQKAIAVLSTRHPKISTPNRIHRGIGGYVSVQNIKSHIYGYTPI